MDTSNKRPKLAETNLKDPRILSLLFESKFLKLHELEQLFVFTAKNMKTISMSGGKSKTEGDEESKDGAKIGDDDDNSAIYKALCRYHWGNEDIVASLMTTTGASGYKDLFQQMVHHFVHPSREPRYAPSDYTMLVEARLENGNILFHKNIPGDEIDDKFWEKGTMRYNFDEPLKTGKSFEWDTHKDVTVKQEWRRDGTRSYA